MTKARLIGGYFDGQEVEIALPIGDVRSFNFYAPCPAQARYTPEDAPLPADGPRIERYKYEDVTSGGVLILRVVK